MTVCINTQASLELPQHSSFPSPSRKKMSMGTRKRSAPFLLEKPLVSRLRFDKELAECKRHLPSEEQTCIFVDPSSDDHSCRSASLHRPAGSATVFPAHAEKRTKLGAAAEEDVPGRDAGDVGWCSRDISREKRKEEVLGEVTPGDGDAELWSAIWGRAGAGPLSLGRGRGDQSESQAGCGGEKSSEKEAEAVDPGPSPERALVQLKIDAMFFAGSSTKAVARSGQLSDVRPVEGAECAAEGENVAAVDRGMDVEGASAEAGPTCYSCKGELGTEGGDVLCSFCDRAACQSCSQNCFSCEIPHCSLCLTTDFSSQFECYFCPPCYQDKRSEVCQGDSSRLLD